MPKHIDNRILLIRTERSEIKIIDSITKSWEKNNPSIFLLNQMIRGLVHQNPKNSKLKFQSFLFFISKPTWVFDHLIKQEDNNMIIRFETTKKGTFFTN